MRVLTCALAVAIALGAGCSKPPEPTRYDVQAGVHRVSARAPAGWIAVDLPEQQQAVIKPRPPTDAEQRELDRRGEASFDAGAEVRLRDFGPVTPRGLRREVTAIADLWRTGDAAEARKRVLGVRSRAALVPALAPPSDFVTALGKIYFAAPTTPYEALAPHFATVAAALDTASPVELDAVVDWALPRVDHSRLADNWYRTEYALALRGNTATFSVGGDFWGEPHDALAGHVDAQRRDTVWRKTVQVDGREAEEIETWGTLTHATPRRLLFLLNDEHLLVVTSEFGGGEHSIRGYETIRPSLRLTR
jgi:hypothetical protein